MSLQDAGRWRTISTKTPLEKLSNQSGESASDDRKSLSVFPSVLIELVKGLHSEIEMATVALQLLLLPSYTMYFFDKTAEAGACQPA